MGALRTFLLWVALAISIVLTVPAFGEATCGQPVLTKTEIVIKALEALRERGIGLVSFDNLYIKIDPDGCGYRVIIRDEPPKPSGLISVELAPNGAVRRVNLD